MQSCLVLSDEIKEVQLVKKEDFADYELSKERIFN